MGALSEKEVKGHLSDDKGDKGQLFPWGSGKLVGNNPIKGIGKEAFQTFC